MPPTIDDLRKLRDLTRFSAKTLKRRRAANASAYHVQMIAAWGEALFNRTCGECRFLAGYQRNVKVYYKCKKSGVDTRGPASDWRKKWPGCGCFEPIPEEKTHGKV